MKRILVIEDEPDIQELIVFNLKTNGYDATGTDNANDALIHVEDVQFDLIVLDLMVSIYLELPVLAVFCKII